MATSRSAGAVRQGGFTLIELMIVLSLLSLALIVSTRAKVSEAEELLAKAAGQQMRDVGVTAVSAYMAAKYCITVPAASGCQAGSLVNNPTTTVTIAQLVAENFLPAAFSGVNPWGRTYQIQFRRTGAGPDYNIEALTLLSDGNGSDNTPIKDHLVGLAIGQVGPEGGLTINATTFRGYKATGDDTSASANFPGLTFNSNQLGAKVSYAGAMFNAFLRRDGSLPMTGPNPLNMGNQSIVAANDVAATTVTIPNTGDINFGPRNRKMSWLLPRLVEMEGYYVNDGNGIPKPTCDTGGQQSVVLAGVATRGQVYAGDSMAHVRLYVENVGSAWVARIKGWDLTTSADGGGGFPSGFARTFCYYP